MSDRTSEVAVLARLATCDAELSRLRSQRAVLVRELEQQRRSIASLRTRPPRRAARGAVEHETGAHSAPSERITVEEHARHEELVRDFEENLEHQAPLLVKLAEDVLRIEERRNDCLRQLSLRIQTAYAARVAAGRLPAIACAVGDRCGECGHGILDALKTDQHPAIVICDSCQRLVYASPPRPRERR